VKTANKRPSLICPACRSWDGSRPHGKATPDHIRRHTRQRERLKATIWLRGFLIRALKKQRQQQ